MAVENRPRKHSKLRSQGLKSLITAASLAATIGGWGALSIGDAQTAAGSQPTGVISDTPGQVALPTPPAGTSPADPGSTNRRFPRRGGRFGQAPSTGSLPSDGTQPTNPMGITRSSR